MTSTSHELARTRGETLRLSEVGAVGVAPTQAMPSAPGAEPELEELKLPSAAASR